MLSFCTIVSYIAKLNFTKKLKLTTETIQYHCHWSWIVIHMYVNLNLRLIMWYVHQTNYAHRMSYVWDCTCSILVITELIFMKNEQQQIHCTTNKQLTRLQIFLILSYPLSQWCLARQTNHYWCWSPWIGTALTQGSPNSQHGRSTPWFLCL